MDNSNQLLHFLTAATSNLQEALSKPSNGKKVNHRRYIQKRLQKREPSTNNSKSAKKTSNKPSATPLQGPISNNTRPHPIAAMNSPLYWPSQQQQHVTSYYNTVQQHVVPPMASVTPPLSNSPSSSIHSGYSSRPHSAQPPNSYDANLESLLTEIGLETYTAAPVPAANEVPCTSNNTLSRHSSLNTVHWDTYLPPNEFIPSPHSDFSDVDDSAYSSPCGPSPVNNYYPIQQVCSPPNTTVATATTSCYHHVATGSCEWLPSHHHSMTSSVLPVPTTAVVAETPSFLNMTSNLAVPSSLNEILELVTP